MKGRALLEEKVLKQRINKTFDEATPRNVFDRGYNKGFDQGLIFSLGAILIASGVNELNKGNYWLGSGLMLVGTISEFQVYKSHKNRRYN